MATNAELLLRGIVDELDTTDLQRQQLPGSRLELGSNLDQFTAYAGQWVIARFQVTRKRGEPA